ncbi:MAG: hypothetical protein ACRC2H_01020 [Silanimonas sp.]
MAEDIEKRISEQLVGNRGERPHDLLSDALKAIRALRTELETQRGRVVVAGQKIAEMTDSTAA